MCACLMHVLTVCTSARGRIMEMNKQTDFLEDARSEWDRLNPISRRCDGGRGQQLLCLFQASAISYFAPLRFAAWLVAAATRRVARNFAS